MTLEEFEKQLREQITGHELEMMRLQNFHMEKETFMKDKFMFKVEAAEVALRETKLKYRKEVEQVSMALNDMESKLI
jgi:hypothetical protein